MLFGEDDDLVRPVVLMARRRRPPRRSSRTVFRPDPVPFVAVEEPALVIRDVFVFVKDIVVFRDGDFFGSCHDDRAGRGRDDLLRGGDDDRLGLHDDRLLNDRRRCFHDDRFLNDRRRRFHDDRGRTRLDDRADQVHDVGRKPDAVGWTGFTVIPSEGGGGSEDDRRGESGADDDGLVDGLLSSVSFWMRGLVFSPERIVLDFLIILYYEIFVKSN